jgi:hypothetical protein
MAVLVQPEIESWRSPLASIASFLADPLRGPHAVAAGEQATAVGRPGRGSRTAPGFNFQMRGNPFPTPCFENRPQSEAVRGDGLSHAPAAPSHALDQGGRF